MRSLELILTGLLIFPLGGNGFDLCKGVMQNQLTIVYWMLESGHSPHFLLPNGLLPLEHAYNNNLTEMTDLLAHFSIPIETTINSASIDDAEAIAYIHYHSWNTTYGEEFPSKTLEERVSFWKRLLTSPPPNHQVLVLRVSGRIIAFCGYTNNNKDVEIIGFYVHPAFQRMGAGKKILNYLITSFGSETFFYLWVFEKNLKAISFYEKNDFKKSESESKMYPNTDKKLLKFELRV